jgi:hypothetical protein
MAGLAEEINNNDLESNFIHKYYGSASLGGIDLLVFYKLFKVENNAQVVNGVNYVKRADEILKKFNNYDKSPVWMVKNMIENNNNMNH